MAGSKLTWLLLGAVVTILGVAFAVAVGISGLCSTPSGYCIGTSEWRLVLEPLSIGVLSIGVTIIILTLKQGKTPS